MAEPSRPYSLTIFPDSLSLAAAAAEHIAALMQEVVAKRGVFHWALAGGRTPAALYRVLATASYANLPWKQVHIWFGDERTVPHDHPDSNFRMARESLLDNIPLPAHQVHPMPSDLITLRQGARAYAQCLESLLPHHNGVPCLDLILLGMGADGHIASLFPGSCALHQTHQATVAVYAPGPRTWRVTLTRPVIDHAHQVLLLVTGADKAATLAQALAPNPHDPLLPIQRLAPRGKMVWYLDAAAASLLTHNQPRSRCE
ncbi:6-phosphogluconolactonase [Gammaproteobacteria bacterium]